MATYSYGQGFTVTPIQAISAFATIANKGKRMKPQIVEEVIDNGTKIPVTQKLEETVLKEDSAVVTSEMLRQAFIYNLKVNGDTKKYVNELSSYAIAGKSGTAQIARSDGPGYYTDQVNTTYVGFDASPDSKFVMLIKLHKPKDADFSASNVFPLWVETFRELKDLLGVEKIK
jgi:penicillin-binding protein 2B